MSEQCEKENEACPVRCQKIGDETVIHDAVSGKITFLNRTAGEVLQMRQEGLAVDEIVKRLQGSYGVDADADITHDVEVCLKELRELGLLEAPSSR